MSEPATKSEALLILLKPDERFLVSYFARSWREGMLTRRLRRRTKGSGAIDRAIDITAAREKDDSTAGDSAAGDSAAGDSAVGYAFCATSSA
jgi:hypothetical protein